MKINHFIFFAFIFLIFQGCNSSIRVAGKNGVIYTAISGEDLKFNYNPKTFEYFNRTEGGLQAYSAGNWHENKNIIILNGFNDTNLNILSVKSKLEDYPNNTYDKLVIQYHNHLLDTFIKVDVIINQKIIISIKGDTAFLSNNHINTLQIRSYLVHTGFLLGYPTRVDTLISHKIKIKTDSNKRIKVLIKLNIAWQDFYRIKLNDTLLLKNNKTILWDNNEFKRNK